MSSTPENTPAVLPESTRSGAAPKPLVFYLTPGQNRFLESLQYATNDDSVASLCRAAGIHRSSYYRWQREPGFNYVIGRAVTRHLAVSTQLLLARGMNSALQGDARVWKTMFSFMTSPGAVKILKDNLAALAADAQENGHTCTIAWDRNRTVGPHHQIGREDQAAWRRNLDYIRDIGGEAPPSIYVEHPSGEFDKLPNLEPYFDPESKEWQGWKIGKGYQPVEFPVDNDSLPPDQPAIPSPAGEPSAQPAAKSAVPAPRQPGFLARLLHVRRQISRGLAGLRPVPALAPIRA